jgi:hypothetical protein
MLSSTQQPANFETCMQDLIDEAQLTKSDFINFANDKDKSWSYQMTASKKLIAHVLKSFESQTSKIQVLSEMTDEVISDGFEKAYKDIN